jgi:hypothetical protein
MRLSLAAATSILALLPRQRGGFRENEPINAGLQSVSGLAQDSGQSFYPAEDIRVKDGPSLDFVAEQLGKGVFNACSVKRHIFSLSCCPEQLSPNL